MKKSIPFLIILTTLCVQLSSGMNYIIFPLNLVKQGYSNALIGIAMSFEILATIVLFKHISIIVNKIGVIQTIIGASIFRSLVIYFLGFNDNYMFWLLGIFLYGINTSILLVILQTWLNMTIIGKLKGFFIGLYSSFLSLGIALGPVSLQFISDVKLQFLINAIIPLSSIVILMGIFKYKPKINTNSKIQIKHIFKHAKIVLLSAFVGGVCFFGLPSFLTIYGINNGLSSNEAALLLTMFMIGSVCLGLIISSLSAFVDRTLIVFICTCIAFVCAVFLALAVFSNIGVALMLLLIWGGCMGGIYSCGIGFIGETFQVEDQISANTSFILMDALGGYIGLLLIGISMDVIGDEGLTYSISFVFICFLVFITKQMVAKLN